MLNKLIVGASALALVACSATSMSQTARNLRTANNAIVAANSIAASSNHNNQAAPATASLADATPISGEALAVPLRKTRGKKSVLTAKPRIAVVGYNIAAITQSRAVAHTSGGFTRNSASASMTMQLAGVDDALLRSVADDAFADLIAQLSAAGINVVGVDEIKNATDIGKILPGTPSYDGDLQRGNGDGKIHVTGPTATGVSTYNALGKMTFNGNTAAKSSSSLNAVLLFPNLSLGFAQTGGSGNSMFARRASVEGGALFNVDTATKVEAVFSKDGRFVDGWATYGIKENVGTPDAFAQVVQTGSEDNSLAVGLSAALGVGMGSRSKSEYTVVADPDRYRALALKAAKGYNAALVDQVLAARNGS